MSGHRKTVSIVCGVIAGIVGVGEHVEAIHSHLPEWVQMHSQDAIILILLGLIVYLISTQDEGSAPAQTGIGPFPNLSANGGNATANPSVSAGNSTATSKLADTIYLGGQPAPPPEPIPQQPPKKRALHISPIKARIAWVNEGGIYGNVFYEPEERDEVS